MVSGVLCEGGVGVCSGAGVGVGVGVGSGVGFNVGAGVGLGVGVGVGVCSGIPATVPIGGSVVSVGSALCPQPGMMTAIMRHIAINEKIRLYINSLSTIPVILAARGSFYSYSVANSCYLTSFAGFIPAKKACLHSRFLIFYCLYSGEIKKETYN
jgi:hypothetical protein